MISIVIPHLIFYGTALVTLQNYTHMNSQMSHSISYTESFKHPRNSLLQFLQHFLKQRGCLLHHQKQPMLIYNAILLCCKNYTIISIFTTVYKLVWFFFWMRLDSKNFEFLNKVLVGVGTDPCDS